MKNNISAFPHPYAIISPEADSEVLCNPGLTIRDYFAAKIMAQFAANGANADIVAAKAYIYADEMIKARGQQ